MYGLKGGVRQGADRSKDQANQGCKISAEQLEGGKKQIQ
jgi:hypothetical protein